METESIEAESMDDEQENEMQGAVNNNLSIDNMDIDLDELDFNFEEEGEGEGEGEVEVEGEEEDEEDEEEYTLRFQGEMDPLAFAENDQSGAQPYEQFQRLEYETLAARKRKQHQLNRDDHTKKATQKDLFGASMDEILEAANFGLGRREHKRKSKKSGRRKGEGPKLTPEVTRKLGEANLLYATGRYDEAVDLLQDVIRLIPNVPDPYHTLALVYISLGDKTKAINFYMIAAHLTPKDSLLWKRLASYSMEQGNTGQLIYCLTKAMKADPDDMAIKWDRASLYVDLNDYHRAAEAFDQIAAYRPSDVEAWKMAAKMHHRSGQSQRAREVLEKLIDEHPSEADLTVVNLLAALHMENKTFSRAIQHIEHARMIYCSGQGLPPELAIKAGICYAHLGNLEQAENFFEDLHAEQSEELAESIIDVADAYTSLGHHHRALEYYSMLEGTTPFENAHLWLKVAQCHAAVESYSDAIKFYYKALDGMPDNVDVRLTLASLLIEHDRTDEAIQLLLPPQHIEQPTNDASNIDGRPWWSNGKVKKKLAQIYQAQGKAELFVEAIASSIKETLYLETLNQKVRMKNKLPKSVLSERVKWLDDSHVDNVFRGFRPILSTSDMNKALRARRRLAKLASRKEEKKAAALAAGLEWQSDSDDEELPEPVIKEPPLPDLLKDEEHYELIIEICKALASLKRYWEALEIINHSLKLGHNHFCQEKQDELRSLGAQVAYNTTDPKNGYDCARYIVQQHPYSLGAWNCYYKVVSRLESRVGKHGKFMLAMRAKYPDCVPPMVICGHQFAMISQSQGALREYLEAYKTQPDNPLINLCVGTSFINLALGFRVNNRNQCVVQGFAFLYNYQRLCKNNQESNYNLARAYQHVGLVHLAVLYYEKVLAHYEKDHPIPKLPHEDTCFVSEIEPKLENYGHCDLGKEAAYNLHLIYKNSGAVDLARQVLKDYCKT
ncbi:hypothetical protein SUGI_0241430 [Cryptomeria japonica]|uniref:uncharacterized protein LOC131029625 n=1 Tax=Cryptomeria japonica TaxID=3369 RepID=UPI002408C464|nr:uncharacterized protein LOC131029625 [Cryptomeria japonica]GLJ14841.1 hypothetical protein SUGI_0241430 [Cryptomeria japonica]